LIERKKRKGIDDYSLAGSLRVREGYARISAKIVLLNYIYRSKKALISFKRRRFRLDPRELAKLEAAQWNIRLNSLSNHLRNADAHKEGS